jgi:restriction endonuclease Mrr
MRIPDYQTFMLPLLLKFLVDVNEHTLEKATKAISDGFSLTRKTSLVSSPRSATPALAGLRAITIMLTGATTFRMKAWR